MFGKFQMEKYKVYYGEYSLAHWIKLILSKKIELPSYQRNFVWSEDKVKKLIESLKSGLFVPPVIIGTYCSNNEEKHYIIDGQQRLSAILLTYLEKFPNKGFEGKNDSMADDNDNNEKDEVEDDEKIDIRNWKLEYIQEIAKKCQNKAEIQKHLKHPFYKELEEIVLPQNFFEKTLIGFSYIKPNQIDEKEQKRYYSSVFRNINISGQPLTDEESRSSLYWLDSDLEQFFKPKLMDNIIIDNNKIDFARYLAFTAEYLKQYRTRNKNIEAYPVAKGYGSKTKPFEEYIEKFVYHCVGEDTSSTFPSRDELFFANNANYNYSDAINEILHVLSNIKDSQKFPSIIDADFYLFGLIFWLLFMSKSFNASKFTQLHNNLEKEIEFVKKDSNYTRRPSSLGRLRNRLYKSILLYKDAILE